MDSYVHIRPKKELTVSTRAPYPVNSVPECGDDWCLNGPPGIGNETYFMCETCGKGAPDAIRLGYAVRTANMKPGDRIKINASVFTSFVSARLKAKLKSIIDKKESKN